MAPSGAVVASASDRQCQDALKPDAMSDRPFLRNSVGYWGGGSVLSITSEQVPTHVEPCPSRFLGRPTQFVERVLGSNVHTTSSIGSPNVLAAIRSSTTALPRSVPAGTSEKQVPGASSESLELSTPLVHRTSPF